MRLKRLSFFLLGSPAVIDAFSSSRTQIVRQTALSASDNISDVEKSSFSAAMRNMAVTSAVALALIMPPSAIAEDTAQVYPSDNAVYSSTMTLSDVIKTMDFSLPSSYDNIADPVASGVDELTTSTVKGSSKKVEKKKVEKKKSAPATNKGLSLPSFGGGGGDKPTINSDAFKPKTAEEKAADLAARRAEREEAANAAIREKAEAERRAAAERDANIKAARLEKIAKREEEAAKKAAEESAKREAMMKDVVVVDTSMPQY